jgi:hypothetical protein
MLRIMILETITLIQKQVGDVHRMHPPLTEFEFAKLCVIKSQK